MSKFVKNLIFAATTIITFAAGFVFGWQCKKAAVERKEDDEANGVRRYHGIRFIRYDKQNEEA